MPDQPTSVRCPARYERVGGRLRGDRIVHCHLEAGHPGEHEEADTEVTWLNDEPTTPEQSQQPTVLRFRSASGRTEIARRPDGAASIHVLHGSDVLGVDEADKAAWALSSGQVQTVDLRAYLDNDLLPMLADMEALGVPADAPTVDALRLTLARGRALQADVAAAYQRGLAAGQAERDQLRRLHEATEAALVQAEQYARDLQDNLAVVDSPALGVSRLVGRWETADEPCCDLHGRNCEQGGEECCEHCTEANHFEIGHGGVPCSSPDLSAVQPEDGGR